jgi:riboflavin biosynthesis pyrimidine reductase
MKPHVSILMVTSIDGRLHPSRFTASPDGTRREGGAKTNGAFLAAQVVDELRVLVAPALDGAEQVQGIVEYRNGLAGVVRMQFKSADVLDHGVVQLAYAVLSPDA